MTNYSVVSGWLLQTNHSDKRIMSSHGHTRDLSCCKLRMYDVALKTLLH